MTIHIKALSMTFAFAMSLSCIIQTNAQPLPRQTNDPSPDDAGGISVLDPSNPHTPPQQPPLSEENRGISVLDPADFVLFEEIEEMLLQPKVRLKIVENTLLSTNQFAGEGNEFEQSRQYIELEIPKGQDPKKFIDELYEELKTFEHFNEGHNTEANVRLVDGSALFEIKDYLTWFGSTYLVWNAKEVPVLLTLDPKNYAIIGHTAEGHMLEGVRFWRIKLLQDPITGGNYVHVITGADCRPVGHMNNWGNEAIGSEKALLIWTQYLQNIAKAYGQEVEVTTELGNGDGGKTLLD